MPQDISGFGTVVVLVASSTFPAGITITQFADDADPLDFASIQIADSAMGMSGELLSWSKAVPLPVVLNVVPASLDDRSLQVLAKNNLVGRGKSSAQDVISLTVVYPDGSTATRTSGRIVSIPGGRSISSSGRLKSNSYAFVFENRIGD